jgi:predicted GNAT family acetyltransferase
VITRHTDPAAYERLVAPLLLRDEPRYNLELALTMRAAAGERWGGTEPLLLTYGDGPGDPDGMALLTAPPHNLLIAAWPGDKATGLAEYVVSQGIQVPGVMGAPAAAAAFADRYAARTGITQTPGHSQGVYVLTTVVPPRPATGSLRLATMRDRDVVVGWWDAFAVEAGLRPSPPEDPEARIADGMQWLWDDGGPVCLVGCGGFTPHGARIGPVYTPPGRRGRGYASAATAAVSAELLGRGLRHTFLYTDLHNPTSNKIYRAIGYEHVADVQEIRFGDE